MSNYFNLEQLTPIPLPSLFSRVLDIFIVVVLLAGVAFLIHHFYKRSRTILLIRGLLLLLLLFLLSHFLGLKSLNWILRTLLNYGIIGLVIVFQPEVRRLLIRMGEVRFLNRLAEKERAHIQNELIEALTYLSRRKTGALLVLRQSDHLGTHSDTGVALNAILSSRLLISLFNKKSLLHDGAVIVNHDKIEAAGCILPLTDNPNLDRTFGTRHRAALGLSEASDAVAIVISEQTGRIAFCVRGELESVSLSTLRDRIEEIFAGEDEKKTPSPAPQEKEKKTDPD